MDNKRRRGMRFEKEVVEFLRKKKFEIKESNAYTRSGEIDIVAIDGRDLVFVEVKSRDLGAGMHPFEAIDYRKQKKIIRCAKEYMMINNISDVYVRFDAAGVITAGDDVIKIEYLKDVISE